MNFDELTRGQKAKGICLMSSKAQKFNVLDGLANLARDEGMWNQCSQTIHRRNMTMLGKTREGYPPAVWKKGFHKVTVRNEHAKVAGKPVHVRQLCKRGYKYVPTRRKQDGRND